MEGGTNRPILKPWPLGWKAKIGILMPSHDTGYASYEYQTLCPEGVVVLETRVMGGKLTMEHLSRMRADAVYAAEVLAVAGVDAMSYIGTAASFIWGVEGDKELIREIKEKTGIKATTGATAVSEALKVLGIKKMILYAPTIEEITAKSITYLEDLGFIVADHQSLGLENLIDIFRISPLETYGGIMKLYNRCPDVDGILLSGGCLRTLEIIDMLEKDTGLPMVLTTPANVWKMLQLAGVKEPVYGFGKLLEMPR